MSKHGFLEVLRPVEIMAEASVASPLSYRGHFGDQVAQLGQIFAQNTTKISRQLVGQFEGITGYLDVQIFRPFIRQFPSALTDYFRSFSYHQQIAIQFFGTVFGAVSMVGAYCLYNYLKIEHISGYKKVNQITEFVPAKQLRIRAINLDGSIPLQKELFREYDVDTFDLHDWGPALRIECFWWTTTGFEKALTDAIGSPTDDDIENKPLVTFYGSNDFHHVALSLIRRWRQQFNLVIFDNHPDWFRLYPIGLHCGCWFTHALNLPTVEHAFHLGGASSEFIDKDGWHPWKEMQSGKLSVFPASSDWKELEYAKYVKNFQALRTGGFITKERARQLLAPHKEQLQKHPLYITMDKDCMRRSDNLQNWNSGELTRSEVLALVEVLIEYSGGKLLAFDVTGDFSKVNVCGAYRHYLHHTQHSDSENSISQEQATPGNMMTNLAILRTLEKVLDHPQHKR